MRADEGSAIAEFSLIALPLCLSSIAATNYCLNVYFDTLLRNAAIASARFASLADTSLADAREFALERCVSRAQGLNARCQVTFEEGARQVAVARFSYQPLSLLVFQPERVIVRAAFALETSKF